ncbi:hypothetical protein AB0C76_09260 [Kitasatospora sp. NPDC048722]|uniref:hypothetical protein n=1 Tax=Kitasatospora sp. NPDC048722 TaxID=3155639 RepID=UPI0033F00AF1
MTTNRWLLRAGGTVLAVAVLAAVAAPAEAGTASPPTRGGTARVSVGLDGAQPDGDSTALGLSANGRYALFSSRAANLVPGDTDNASDVFLRDLREGTVTKVSTPLPGTTTRGSSQEPAISADDRYVVFSSDADNLVPGLTANPGSVLRRDLRTGRTEVVSTAGDGSVSQGGSSYGPFVDAEGGKVLFSAFDGTLVPDDTDNSSEVFLRRI